MGRHAGEGREHYPGDPGRWSLHLGHFDRGQAPATIAGTSTFAGGVLTLADQGGQNGALGKVSWQDPTHFNFRLDGRTNH